MSKTPHNSTNWLVSVRKHEYFVLLGIVLIALLVRLYRVNYPLADWHSWRQADTASVTREYVKHGIDLLHPTYHDLSTIPNNMDNSEHGYRMVEFPFVNATIAFVLRVFPILPLVATSRFFSMLASLGTLVFLYAVVKKFSGKRVAMTTAVVFALLPYSVYYSRVILPEPYVLFFSTLSLWAFSNWMQKLFNPKEATLRNRMLWATFSGLSLSFALLLKPFAVFLAPVYLGIFIFHLRSPKDITNIIIPFFLTEILVFSAIAFIPLYFWRHWIEQFPEGIPASSWLFNSNGIRFRPAWFRWLGYERLTKLFLGYIGVAFLPLAFVKWGKDTIVYALWWVSIGLYFSVIATGNVQHDYYQNLITPIVCISVAVGSWYLISLLTRLFKNQQIAIGTVAALNIVMLVLAWQQVKGYFNVNHWDYVKTGKVVDELTPPDAKVIAPAMGDTQFLFQTNRTGWPIGVDIEGKILKGATVYATTTYDDEARELEQKYTTIQKSNLYLILDLKQPRAEPN